MRIRDILLAPVEGVKVLTNMVFGGYSQGVYFLSNGGVYDPQVIGDGTGSSTVMAPLLWIARTFPEAPPALWEQLENGQEDQVRDHPMLRLLQRPNDFYTGPILWMATIADWSVDGNAYWLKLRDRTGTVRQLWWVPSWMIEPVGDAGTFVKHYRYRPGFGEDVEIEPGDVVHFRFGIDSANSRKGYSPLKSVLQEVFTDDEAARFTAALLRNMGVPGLVVSPEKGSAAANPDDVKAVKAYIQANFTGDKRGEALVMSGPTQIAQFGFSPEQLLLRDLRRIPEERVSAVLGVPAIVAGLGAGLERSTFTNMGEAREMAYESNIIPTQRIIAEDIRFQLLSEFEPAKALWTMRFGFDLAKVRVLQEDLYRQAQRLDLGVRGGWVEVSEARRHLNLEVRETDKVFLRQMQIVVVPADGSPPTVLGQVNENGNGNGNGGADTEAIARAVTREIAAVSG